MSAPDTSPAAAGPVLRSATLDDLDAVWSLETSVFGAEAWSRSMMREELVGDHRDYRVLVDGRGRVLGYAGMLALGAEADIQTIAVHPDVRGTGQGRRLIDALLEGAEARGVNEVFLEVRADNPVAQKLYESLGFEGIGTRPRYYQPEGVDAIVMRLAMGGRTRSGRAMEDQA